MSAEQLESLWHVTEAVNWMTFEEFEELVDLSDVTKDTNGVLSLFKVKVH